MRITESQLRRVIRDVIKESTPTEDPDDLRYVGRHTGGIDHATRGNAKMGQDRLVAELERIEAMGDQVKTGTISYEISKAIKSIKQMLGLEKSGIRHID